MKSTVVLAVVALVSFCALTVSAQPSDATPTESPRVAVPDTSASQQALKTVKDLFQSEYIKAKLPAEKRQLAAKLLQVAHDTPDDPASRYVLFLEAQRLATEAGDVSLALQVVDAVVKEYLVDPIPTKAKVLSSVNEKPLPVEARKAVSEAALAVVTEAIATDQYDAAKQIGSTALAAARQAKDIELVKRVAAIQAELDETAKAYLQAKGAFTTLKENPNDPQANTSAGSFLCFEKADWKTGLPMLAQSNDAELQALAREEISPNPVALTLGDGWWSIAESKKGRTADNIKTHAVEWYERALPEATGLLKAKIEKRLKEASLASQTKGATPKANIQVLRKRFAPDADKIGNHYYKVFLVAKPWEEASKVCKQMGGYLACTETEAEQNEVAKLKGKSMVWVGGYRKDDKFVWISNEEPVPSDRFKGDAPKDGYLSFSTIALDKLVARKPDEAQVQGFICEWDE